MDTNSLRAVLADLPVPDLKFFQTIDSTNEAALRWAESGAADGSLVVAEAQTAGRGRMGRRWITTPGSALAFSLILKPEGAAARPGSPVLGLYSPLGALGLSDALLESGDLPVEIKWPNDVLIRGKKVAGILVESAWLGDRLQSVVIGIGVNIAPESVPPQEDLLFPATSVAGEKGRVVDRERLLAQVLARIFAWRANLAGPEFLRTWEARLAFKGQPVEIRRHDDTVRGTVLGVTADGNLRLRSPQGVEFTVVAGDVKLRPLME